MGNNEDLRKTTQYKEIRAVLKSMPGGDICWRCGEKIDLNAPHNTPEEWTADHVQSLANGGDPYSIHNLKPAHRSCNAKRGRALLDSQPSRLWYS
jgi:5-methylcytosine-specific restriction endonuclease McrA